MTDSANKPDDAPKPVKKNRRWLRRLKWITIVLLAGAVLMRLAIAIAFPLVLSRVAAIYDLDADYERKELTLLGGDAGLWHFSLTPKSGGQPVFQAGYVRGHISTFALLLGRLDVWRVEADGVDLRLERLADGRIPLLARLTELTTPTTAPATPADASTEPLTLDAPLRIDAFRLSRVRLRLIDRTLSPVLDREIALNVRVSDLGSTVRPTRFELETWSYPLLDSLRIDGEGTSRNNTIDATFNVYVLGLRPANVQAYLEPLGLSAIGEEISLTASGTLKTQPLPAPLQAVTGRLELGNVAAIVGGRKIAGLKSLVVDASHVDLSSVRISHIDIQDAAAEAERGSDGRLNIAGLKLVGATSSTTRPTTQPTRVSIGPSIAWGIDKVTLSNGRLAFRDRAVAPTTELLLDIDHMDIGAIASDRPTDATPFDLAMRSPRMARSIALKGTTAPLADRKTLQIAFDLDGVKPDAVKPYLDAMGIESTLRGATLVGKANAALQVNPDGELHADAVLSELYLADGSPLVSLNDVRMAGASFNPTTGLIKVDSIDVTGPRLSARREMGGGLSVVGLRTRPPVRTSIVPVIDAAPVASTQPIRAPRVQLGRFTWTGLGLDFEDQTTVPSTRVWISDAGVEVFDLLLDLESKRSEKPGKFQAWLTAPGLADGLTIDGTVTPEPNTLTADWTVSGVGLNGDALAAYLKPFNITPVLQAGALSMKARASLRQVDDALRLAVGVTDLRYTGGAQTLMSAGSFGINNIAIENSQIIVGDVTLTNAEVTASREADGSLVAAGFKWTPPATPSVPDVKQAAPGPVNLLELPFVATLNSMKLDDARFIWTDATTPTPVSVRATLSSTLNTLTLGKDAPPATFEATLVVDDTFDRLHARGSALTTPARQRLNVSVDGSGIRAGRLAPYLPPGLELSTTDGRLTSQVDAGIATNADGGFVIDVTSNGVDWRDGERSLFKVTGARVDVPRFDWTGEVVDVREVSVKGLETDIVLNDNGVSRLLGLALTPVAQTAPREAGLRAPVAGGAQTIEDIDAILARARRALPTMSLSTLDVGVKRLSLRDASRPDAAALTVSDLSLKNIAPVAWGGKNIDENAPGTFELTTKVEPVIGSASVRAVLNPFIKIPTVTLDVSATGIDGAGLLQLVPEIAPFIDAAGLTSGTFTSHVELQANYDRRGPTDFDLSRGFGLELVVKDTAYRATPDGPVLAGVDSVLAESVRIEPRTGSIKIKTLEILEPAGVLVREADGLHALGMVFKLPATEDATEPTEVDTNTPAVPATQPLPTTAPTGAPAGELSISKLIVSGLDLRLEDRTVTPAMVVPLNALDVEVRDLSNRVLTESRYVRFNAVLGGGKIDVINPRTGSTEQRDVFSQVSAGGRVRLFPVPSGFAKASVNGLELQALRGVSRDMGVTLGGGVFDTTVDVRINENGMATPVGRLVFTDLSVSELPDGPIRSLLKLPTPLDAALGLLTGADGSITIPINRNPTINTADASQVRGIGSAAAGAVGSVLINAIASSPLKVLDGAGGLLGLKKDEVPADEVPVVVDFAPGYTGLESEAMAELSDVIKRLNDEQNTSFTLRHTAGTMDLDTAGTRANPDPGEVNDMTYRLRQWRNRLLSERADLVGTARGEVAALGPTGAQATLTQLRTLDQRLSRAESSLDMLYEMLRPGAERQAARRTKAAAVEIGERRLEAIKQMIVASGVRDAENRVTIINPSATPGDTERGRVEIIAIVRKKG